MSSRFASYNGQATPSLKRFAQHNLCDHLADQTAHA
jgi:hypothetical protein